MTCQLIVTAIVQQRRLSFRYNGRQRIVEPQAYGVGTSGAELLRGHQIVGGVQKEPLFTVAKMEALVALDESFERPGPNYRRGDSAMRVIFAEL